MQLLKLLLSLLHVYVMDVELQHVATNIVSVNNAVNLVFEFTNL